MKSRILSGSYIRNFTFGVEDSLVSTVGLLSGIALAGVSAKAIILTGIVLVFVEGFSMAAGSFLSEQSAEEYVSRAEVPPLHAAVSSGIMFVSYIVSGFIPLFPYFFLDTGAAFRVSILLSLATLACLGVIGARLSHTRIFRRVLEMLVIGGAAITVGIIAGQITAAFGVAI